MTTGWSHPRGLSPAEVEERAKLAEEKRKQEALNAARRPPGKNAASEYKEYGAPELTGRSRNSGSNSGSVSRSYDYTGMDEAAKVAQALQAVEGSFIGVALSDPMKIPELQNSIRSMQQYLAAYRSGNGLPPVRVSSESLSSSSSPGSSSSSFGRKQTGTHVLPDDDKPVADAQPAPHVPAPADNPGNEQLEMGQKLGIPEHVDQDVDPRRFGAQKPAAGVAGKTQQGPPMPGLMHSASLWDLDYYA